MTPPEAQITPLQRDLLAAYLASQPAIPGRSPTRPCPGKRVLIRAHLYAHGGYGQVAEWFGRGLDALGVPVAYEPVGISEEFLPLPAFVRERVVSGATDQWEFLIERPICAIRPDRHAAWCSMWECTRLAKGDPERLNQAEVLIVPSEWCVKVFRDSGVTRPIRVVPLGISPEEGYRHVDDPPGRPCVFGTVGKMAHGPNRKGIFKAARAFLRAFPTERDVQLRIKCLPDCLSLLGDLPSDPRIKVTSEPLSAPDMADWCRACTAGIFATSGEGFGLPGLQFMALGRPVIMPVATGQASYFDGQYGYAVPWRWAHAGDYFTGTGGDWAEPDPEGLEAGLRWVYEHPEEAREKGRAGALRALEFTWTDTARALRKALVEFGLIPNPYKVMAERIKQCPHRDPAPGCGCAGGGICKAGKGDPRDGFVSLATCTECLGESD